MSSMIHQLKDATKSWGNQSTVRSGLRVICFIASAVSCLLPVMLQAAAQPGAESSIQEVTVERGRLTLSVQNALLAEVLQAIGEEAGIAIEIHGDLTERITTSFADIPLEEGLRQLLRGKSFALSYAPSAGDAQRSRLMAISVLPRSLEKPAAKASKVSTVGEQREKLRRIRVLAGQQDTKAVRELSALALNDPNPFVRSRAISVLGRLRKPENLAPLTWALKDQFSSVRIQALQGIKNLKGGDAVGDLQAIMVNDPDPAVRRQAVRLLSTIGSPEVPSVLKWAVADNDAAVSREAKGAVTRWEQRFGAQYGTAGITH
jgi:HEAT repeats